MSSCWRAVGVRSWRISDGARVGNLDPSVAPLGAAILAIMSRRPHPEQGFRTCLGVLRLYRDLDPVRAERVSARAIAVGAFNYKSIASIIAHNLDRIAPTDSTVSVDGHANIRGRSYFN